jgi:hypothetical protein
VKTAARDAQRAGARASRPHNGRHKRGYLPHFDAGAMVQAILPRSV